MPRWCVIANRVIDAALIVVGLAALATVPAIVNQIMR